MSQKPWRPENWKGCKRTAYTAHNTEEEVYEAGADAMLEAVKSMGIYTPKIGFKGGVSLPGGWSIYLPEEE